MKILISGSSGLIGSALVKKFIQDPTVTFHSIVRDSGEYKILGAKTPQDEEELWDGADALIHLAGESIADQRWNKEKKQRIMNSRIEGTRRICEKITRLKNPPKRLLVASAIGYYGDRGHESLTESSSAGEGFLASVCKEWEAATFSAKERGIPVASLRIGLVLSINGGALEKMLPIFKMGFGGVLGSGEQVFSWISLPELIRIIHFMLAGPPFFGPVNCVTPFPVSNREFTKTLGAFLHRPTFFHLPSWVIRLIFGEMGQALFLSSSFVVPKMLIERGFEFKWPHLQEALEDLLSKKIDSQSLYSAR